MGDPLRPWERRNGARVHLASDALQRALGTTPAAPTTTPTLEPPPNGASPAVGGHTPTPSSTLGSPFAYTDTSGSTTPFSALPRYEHRTTTTSSSHPSTLDDSAAPASTIQRYPTRHPSPSGWYPRTTGPSNHLTEPSPSAPRAPARTPTTRRSPSPSWAFRLRPSPVLVARSLRTLSPFRPRPVPALPSQRGSSTSDSFRLRPSPVLPRAFVFTTAGTTVYEPNTSRVLVRSPPRGRSPPRREPYTPPRQITGAALRGGSSGYSGYGYEFGRSTYSYVGGDGGFWDSLPMTRPESSGPGSETGSGIGDGAGEWWEDPGF